MKEVSFLLSNELLEKALPGHMLIDQEQMLISQGTLVTELFGQNIGLQMPDVFVFEDLNKNKIDFNDIFGDTIEFISVVHQENNNSAFFKLSIDQDRNSVLLNLETKNDIPEHSIIALKIRLEEQLSVSAGLESLLIKTQLRMEKLIEDSHLGLLIEDEHRNIINVNQTFCQTFGIPVAPELLIGVNCAESAEQSKHLFKDPGNFVNRVNEILDARVAVQNELLELVDGRFLKRDYLPMFIDDRYSGHMWKYIDITESKTLELRIKNQKEFYEKILNNLPADIAVFDKEHHYLFVNPKGITDNELRQWIIGKTDFDYCALKNKDVSLAQSRRTLFNDTVGSKSQKRWEEHMIDKNGQDQYLMRMMHPTFTETGELDLMIGYGIDITERKNIELRVAQSETRFRGLFEKSPALISIHDLNGQLIDVNQTTLDVLGYSKEELLGKSMKDFLGDEGKLHIENNYRAIIEKNGKDEGITVAKTKSGEEVHLLYQNHLVSINEETPYILGFAQDITANIIAELELKKSEEKYKRIIESMNLGLVEVDNNGHIIYANSCFCQMISFNQEDLINKNVAQIYESLNSDINVQEALSKQLSGASDSYELRFTDKNGIPKWMLVSGAPVRDKNGMVKGAIGIHLEITQQKILEGNLRKAIDEAENSAQAKEVFLANMSHEIRTPLNAVIGISGLLAKTKIDEQQHFFLSNIQTAAQNLLVIINDLLDFSKIESGNLHFEEIEFNITDLLLKTKQILLYKAEEKGVAINFVFDPKISPVLIGDPFRLNQVVLNVVGNAIKFTEKGSVTIIGNVVSEDDSFQQVRIEVRDTGIGISDEFLANLFDKFVQEDKTITRKYGGTGLGMSISKELVEKMGGTLEVSSQKNIGTSFFINLNLPKGERKKEQLIEYKKLDTGILKGKKILLAEDNEMNRLLACTLLGQYGVLVDEAEDGNVAINKFQHQKYDLVLMDLQMPEMDGIQATKHIRKKLDSKIPVIALTANVFKEEQSRCYAAGMNDFISKPFEEEEFIQLICRWLLLVEEALGKSVQEPLLFDVRQLLKIGKSDQVFLKKMLLIYVSSMPESIKKMQEAFKEENWTLLGSIAHKIKASLAGMEVNSIAEDIKSLDSLNKQSSIEKENVELLLNKVVTVIQQSIIQIKSEYPQFFD